MNLDRALQQGTDVAQNYIDELQNQKLLPTSVSDAKSALLYLMEEEDFIFRSDTAQHLMDELDLAQKLDIATELDDKYGHFSRVTPFWNKVD